MGKDTLINESLLWSKFLSGDDDAYSHIYEQYVQILFKYGFQFTTDRELIKDCVQDVFEKIHKNRNKLVQTDNIKLYLFVILKNNLLNTLKRERNHMQVVNSIEDDPQESDNTVENQIIKKEEDSITEGKIKLIFSLLTPRQKEVIYYRFVESMSINDIASLMDMNYQSIQNLIQRSIKKIKKDIKYE